MHRFLPYSYIPVCFKTRLIVSSRLCRGAWSWTYCVCSTYKVSGARQACKEPRFFQGQNQSGTKMAVSPLVLPLSSNGRLWALYCIVLARAREVCELLQQREFTRLACAISPRNLTEELSAKIELVWNNIGEAFIRKLYRSINKRLLHVVLDANGGPSE